MSEPLTWSHTRARLRADRLRLADLIERARADPPVSVWLHPSFVCVFLYRISSHLSRNGHKQSARLLWHLNMLLTGADISPQADIGEGLVILNPPGVAVAGRAGRNLTLMALTGLGGETGRRSDIGAGPGLPVVGDDVLLEPNSGILGPVRVGDRARIGAAVALTQDVPDDAVVLAHRPRLTRRQDL